MPDTRRRLERVTASEVRDWLHRPLASDDKYSRGVVSLWTGSAQYPGAALLGAQAAVRTGCGLVRYVGPDALGREIVRARPEVVLGDGRSQALVIGSGVASFVEDARSESARDRMADGTPAVIDAGGLDLVERCASSALLTPHARELERLAGRLGVGAGFERLDLARAVADATGATVLLKGSSTLIVSPDCAALEVRAPTSVLATAGTGDVLAGIAGAMLAIECAAGSERDGAGRETAGRPHPLVRVAASAAWVHGRAALLASLREIDPATSAHEALAETSARPASAPVAARDVARAVPGIIGALLGAGAET